MLTLYHARQSRSTRILGLLEELGRPYEIRPVSIFRPMTGTGEGDPANPHPDQRVPALVDGDTIVAESVAIVLYLTDLVPEAGLGPVPGDPLRGAYLTWLAWYAAEFERALFASLTGQLDGNPQQRRDHDAVVRRLTQALAKGPYVLGERFSGADLLIASAIGFARQAFPAGDPIDAYVERYRTRPAVVRGLALDDAMGVQTAG